MHHHSIRGKSLFAMKSGSSHPRLASDWLSEVDLVTCMDDKDHSGSVYDKYRMGSRLLIQRSRRGS